MSIGNWPESLHRTAAPVLPSGGQEAAINRGHRAGELHCVKRMKRLGNRGHRWRSAGPDSGVRTDLAGGREDRVRRTLQTVPSARTRIEPALDADVIRRLKNTSDSDITIGGAALAGQAIRVGLIDDLHLFLGPMLIGGRRRALPANVRGRLELIAELRFRSGVAHLHYSLCGRPAAWRPQSRAGRLRRAHLAWSW
jgi:hypothetical protein